MTEVTPPRCADCGWPTDEVFAVVSRHRGSEGETVYSRCACGALRVWLRPDAEGAARLVARARRRVPPPECGDER